MTTPSRHNFAAHIRVKARNSDGKVCGEQHHRAKWPDAVVALARDIAEEMGFGRRRTCWELRKRLRLMGFEDHQLPGLRIVRHWLEYDSRTLLRPSGALDAYELRGYAIPHERPSNGAN